MRIAYHMMSSPVGLLFLAQSPRGLRYLEYMDRKSLKRMIASHAADVPDATWDPSLLALKPVVDQLDAYFNGLQPEFDIRLDLAGSDFQLKVWRALVKIPFGETRTYGQIAKDIRQPKSSRAVGLANNQNPIAIVVPCHRVIGANGSLTGYGGGLPKKKWLLQHEARHRALEQRTPDLFAVAGREPGRRADR
jgi:methylated-DNA-[protein]-cysteine S-methyltransferase